MLVYKAILLIGIKKLVFCCKNYVFSEVDLENWSNLRREVFPWSIVSWISAPLENMEKTSLQQAVSIAHKYYRLKQYSQVKCILQPFVQCGVQNPWYLLFYGSSSVLLRWIRGASRYHCRIQINPDFSILHARLGNTYVQLGLYDATIE